MRTLLFGALTIAIVGCGSVGHWGSSDGTASVGPMPIPPGGGFKGEASPSFGTTIVAQKPPPAISGGTIAVGNGVAVVADPDRDAIYVVDVVAQKVRGTVTLQEGDEPGRVALDGSGRAHVALRGSGALATIDLATAMLTTRRAACGSPRGVVYDSASDSVHVACATGELVTFPTAGGDATRTVHLGTDLRDVTLLGGELRVSRFRTTDVLALDAAGAIRSQRSAPALVSPYMVPRMAWRMISTPKGDGTIVVHQRASGAIDNSPATSSSSSSSGAPGTSSGGSGSSGSGGGYTSAPGGCSSFTSSKDAVTASLTLFEKTTKSIVMPGLVLPVDVAMSPTSGRIAVAAAGNGHATGTSSLFAVDAAKIPDGASGCVSDSSLRHLEGQLTSVAWVDDDTLLAFSREPAVLYFVPSNESVDVTALKLSNASREDTGHAVFHSNTGAGIACASCHAEGGEDGLVWTFSEQGRRRTPSLKGTLAGTAPYHWSGDLSDTPALVHKVYEEGMAGPALVPDQVDALRGWLFAVPRPANLVALDTVSADRGRGLFEGSAGCSTCHSGARLTNNATVDVGTGGAFQVPSLIGVAHRAPYLHDGCAATLEDRFGKCGGGTAHGNVAVLGATDIADLVSYLKTL